MTTITKPKPKLTAKQESFCIHYFATRNGTQSAIKAGYSPDSQVAQVIATENLRKPLIVARLAALEATRPPSVATVHATVSERLELLTKIARHEIETPVSPGHITQSIAELNKMEHIYETGGNIRDINVIFVIGKGYKDVPLETLRT